MIETILAPDHCGGTLTYEVDYADAPAALVATASLRSSAWSRTRHDHILLEPVCQVCGLAESLNVHHIEPFHEHPELELDPNNLITLCQGLGGGCHFLFGHLRNWSSKNVRVRQHARMFRRLIAERPTLVTHQLATNRTLLRDSDRDSGGDQRIEMPDDQTADPPTG